jgi:hypothetical protein
MEAGKMNRVNDLVARYDPSVAVHYGQFVELAYKMYESAPGNPTPNPPSPFPAGHKFIAWIQMKDFIVVGGNWTFYGLIAQSTTDANKFILAIRGTETLEEWWDDLTSVVLVPWEGFGTVGNGFSRIYQTLRVVYPEALGIEAAARPLVPTATFAHQVAAAVQHHAANARRPHTVTIAVAGHSLGAALATLYVADNFRAKLLSTPLLCTFASPRVGDPVFATNFNQIGITSWRIVNELDVVPNLPFLGFEHIQTLHLYNSASSVRWSLVCWHSLNTYLHLLDSSQPLSADCRWPPMVVSTAPLQPRVQPLAATAALRQIEKEIALSVPPAGGATINITVKIGRTD